MDDKEKRAFVKKMKKAKEAKAKERKKTGGKSKKQKPKEEKKTGVYDPTRDWFKEYKKLGGKLSRKEYVKASDVFIDLTLDIFAYGETRRYKTREAALNAVQKEANLTTKELNLIFQSIDNVTAYT